MQVTEYREIKSIDRDELVRLLKNEDFTIDCENEGCKNKSKIKCDVCNAIIFCCEECKTEGMLKHNESCWKVGEPMPPNFFNLFAKIVGKITDNEKIRNTMIMNGHTIIMLDHKSGYDLFTNFSIRFIPYKEMIPLICDDMSEDELKESIFLEKRNMLRALVVVVLEEPTPHISTRMSSKEPYPIVIGSKKHKKLLRRKR